MSNKINDTVANAPTVKNRIRINRITGDVTEVTKFKQGGRTIDKIKYTTGERNIDVPGGDTRYTSSDADGKGDIRNLYTNGFYNEDDSAFHPTVFSKMFDEPTYLTFRVEFDFSNTLAENYVPAFQTQSIYGTQTYNFMPQPLLSLWCNDTRDINATQSGAITLSGQDVPAGRAQNMGTKGPSDRSTPLADYYSTYSYLRNAVGDQERANMLKRFILALKDIQDNYPYYFTKIDGLGSLMKVKPDGGIRLPYDKGVGGGDGNMLTINCYDGLDMKIFQLMQMYRKVAWDDVYQRWVLPDMMRFFKMRIYVSEIRLFHAASLSASDSRRSSLYGTQQLQRAIFRKDDAAGRALEGINSLLNTASVLSRSALGSKNVVTKAADAAGLAADRLADITTTIGGEMLRLCNDAVNDVMPTLCYECSMCEFDPSDTGGQINSLSSSKTGLEALAGQIRIHVGQVKETQAFPLNMSLQTAKDRYKFGGMTSDEYTDIWATSDDALQKQEYWNVNDPGGGEDVRNKLRKAGAKGMTGPETRTGLTAAQGLGVRYSGGDDDPVFQYKLHRSSRQLSQMSMVQGVLNQFAAKDVLSAATSLDSIAYQVDHSSDLDSAATSQAARDRLKALVTIGAIGLLRTKAGEAPTALSALADESLKAASAATEGGSLAPLQQNGEAPSSAAGGFDKLNR